MSTRMPLAALLLSTTACGGTQVRQPLPIAAAQPAPTREVDLAALRGDNRAPQLLVEEGISFLRADERETSGALWLDTTFTTGTLEVELRGRNVPQRSFVGIAFGAADDSTYEAVYVRPFNFHPRNPAARGRMVQYIAHPAYTWSRLREQQPGVYEHAIEPAPQPDEWNRLRLVVDDSVVRAFVNGAAEPSLTVRRLRPGAGGYVGLWIGNPSPGDFRRMRIGARNP